MEQIFKLELKKIILTLLIGFYRLWNLLFIIKIDQIWYDAF